jgi:hypothetical protein
VNTGVQVSVVPVYTPSAREGWRGPKGGLAVVFQECVYILPTVFGVLLPPPLSPAFVAVCFHGDSPVGWGDMRSRCHFGISFWLRKYKCVLGAAVTRTSL